jgi:hypothetical protein
MVALRVVEGAPASVPAPENDLVARLIEGLVAALPDEVFPDTLEGLEELAGKIVESAVLFSGCTGIDVAQVLAVLEEMA